MKKLYKIIIAVSLVVVFGLSFIGSPTISYFNFIANGGDEGLANAPVDHVCVWECPECGLCLDPDCQEEVCKDKCQGHEKPHECESQCAICGKCLDANCTEEVCKDKCGAGTGLTAYTFEAEDPNVKLVSGSDWTVSAHPDGYVAGLASNPGATVTYRIVASEATTASIQIAISMRSASNRFTKYMNCTVNGLMLETPAVIPASGDGTDAWYSFATVTLGCVQLNEGVNEIVLSVHSSESYAGGNLDKIILKSDKTLTWAPHTCQSVCIICGGCKDTKCQEAVCQQKCVGHSVSASATKYIFEAENSNTVGWSSTMKARVMSGASGGYGVGGVYDTAAKGYYFTFEVYAEQACVANLKFGVGSNNTFAAKSNLASKLNGKTINTNATINSGGWEVFKEFDIAIVELQAGKNVIRIDIGKDAQINMDCIVLLSDVALSANPFA